MSPPGVGDSAGEPSIGSNWTRETIFHNTLVNGTVNNLPNGGSTLYYGGLSTDMLKVTFSDCSSPATATWEPKPLLSASSPRAAGDPILFTDSEIGRTFVAQLEGLTPAGSTIDITDDDGDTFIPSDGVVPSDVDHETIGGGIYHVPLPNPGPVYPHAIYYASQSIAEARALRSDNGGLVFSPAAAPMFDITQCAGLHGHLKVSPADGTVYVPDFACGGSQPFHNGGQQAVIVSEDNGITWNVRPIPDSSTSGIVQEPVTPGTAQTRDPAVAVATDGTVYFAYQAANGHSKVAVSHDKGVTWAPSVDVGASVINGGPVLNATFVAIVAGDPDRAAVTFMGTETGGNNWDCGTGNTCDYGPDFTGVWYLYVATTFDGGATWVTQNITPGDPVQRGGICGGGTCRNLLDFMDARIDKEGRILVGYDDGCVTAGCIAGGPNDFTSKAAIARQSGGMRMFHANDPVEPTRPGAPAVSGSFNSAQTAVTLTWPVPDNGGSAITGYNVYRRVGTSGAFVLLTTTPITSNTYTDTTVDKTKENFYHVTAINLQGEGPYCGDFKPPTTAVATACKLPGILAIDDVNPDGSDNDGGQNTPPDGSVNVKQLFVAEPFFGAGGANDKLVFTVQVAPPTAPFPPNSQWLIVWNRQGTDPSHPSDDASFDRMYVAMTTDASGTPSFEYGKFGIPINTSPPPPPDPLANTPQKKGVPDDGSYDPATGLIRITIANAKFRGIDDNANHTSYTAGTSLGGLNVRTYFNRPDYPTERSQNNASDITNDSSYTLVGNASCLQTVPLLGVVSSKVHGTGGTFDIPLPLTGSAGIECRSPDANGHHKVVFTFANPLASVGSVGVTAGNGTATGAINGQEYDVTLTATNGQQVTITLTGVADTAGNTTPSIAVPIGLLEGDVDASGHVDAGDIMADQRNNSQNVSNKNFRSDVDHSGHIDAGDIGRIQKHNSTTLQH